MSNENVADRIARMVEQLEQAAGGLNPNTSQASKAGNRVGAVNLERVKDTLAFGQETGSADSNTEAAKRPRRERKPSRPLPLL